MIEKSCQYVVDSGLKLCKSLTYVVKKKDRAYTRFGKGQFVEVLKKSQGIVKSACHAVQIPRRTFYQWYETDPDFRREIDTIRREQMGDIEDRLFLAIANNESWAIRMFLTHVHPKYRPKLEKYDATPGKTLEDVLKDYYANKQSPDRGVVPHPEQERGKGAVPLQSSTESLLGAENSP